MKYTDKITRVGNRRVFSRPVFYFIAEEALAKSCDTL